ncbi:uncharacterized protein LOC108511770 isoform X2 [Phoenix dactylifera]|uniref:Uncharacterized protein LOC108511770 isoform X2 n=1 Tax=Phoenix dactylifera TaxID=42345 RepID=A0A8B9A3L5_PHODC|nr:uncharacterized protein LOC108511770 isoform X2 [Phoenix dactylifera]
MFGEAFRKHEFLNIPYSPGLADPSAYVDFASIRHSAEEVSEHISVYDPITQSWFLGFRRINFGVEALLQEEKVEAQKTGYC